MLPQLAITLTLSSVALAHLAAQPAANHNNLVARQATASESLATTRRSRTSSAAATAAATTRAAAGGTVPSSPLASLYVPSTLHTSLFATPSPSRTGAVVCLSQPTPRRARRKKDEKLTTTRVPSYRSKIGTATTSEATQALPSTYAAGATPPVKGAPVLPSSAFPPLESSGRSGRAGRHEHAVQRILPIR